MLPQSILIGEPDHRTLDSISHALFDHIPNIAIDTCTSTEELSRKVERFSYDTVALSPTFLQTYRVLRKKKPNQLLVPLLMTVCQRDLPAAQSALEGDAFDLIVTPIVPTDAAQTVRLSLWQNKLLKLLTSQERVASQFQQHMEAFPYDPKAEDEILRLFETIHETLARSLELLKTSEEENALFDMAALVEGRARRQALARLAHMNPGDPPH